MTKFLLMLVLQVSNSSVDVKFQEFDSIHACRQAQLTFSRIGYPLPYQTSCMPKDMTEEDFRDTTRSMYIEFMQKRVESEEKDKELP